MTTTTPPLISQAIGLHNPPPWLRNRVVGYVTSVETHPDHALPFRDNPRPGAPADIETTVWVLSALRQVGAEDVIECARPRALAALHAAYNPDLGIYEPTATQTGGGPGTWRMHFDAVVRIGFELLDEPPRPFPRGLERLSDFPWAPVGEDAWRPWLDAAWADDPRAAAKAAFQYLWFYTRLTGCNHVDDLDDQARQVLAYMESRRDPATGFIGTGPDVELGWAMRGHRNLALNLLWPLGVDEPGIERMIDATLACQRPDGLFHDGGMCANMDAVHLLAEYGRRTDAPLRRSPSNQPNAASPPCSALPSLTQRRLLLRTRRTPRHPPTQHPHHQRPRLRPLHPPLLASPRPRRPRQPRPRTDGDRSASVTTLTATLTKIIIA